MEIIATLPPPHLREKMHKVAANPDIDMFRFNTGAVTPYDQSETIRKILNVVPEEKLWVDIKGTQIRIDAWSAPQYSEISLNREIEVELPATIYFRHDNISNIVEMRGRKIYVDPLPQFVVGAGQAVNIHGRNYRVKGPYLTDTCRKYIEAARDNGVHRFMLSFLEKQSDIVEVLAIDPDAEICGKIETPAGLELIKNGSWSGEKMRLMAARDDLFINLDFDAKKIFEAQKLISEKDPRAIAASRILVSLEKGEEIALSDLSDIYLLREMGFSSFLLSDGLSVNPAALRRAVSILKDF